jgi:hypothetical protein
LVEITRDYQAAIAMRAAALEAKKAAGKVHDSFDPEIKKLGAAMKRLEGQSKMLTDKSPEAEFVRMATSARFDLSLRLDTEKHEKQQREQRQEIAKIPRQERPVTKDLDKDRGQGWSR